MIDDGSSASLLIGFALLFGMFIGRKIGKERDADEAIKPESEQAKWYRDALIDARAREAKRQK